MPEFYTLRAILAALEALLCWRLIRGRYGFLLLFRLAMICNAIGDAIPFRPHDGEWSRHVLLPVLSIRLFATYAASFDLLHFLRGLTHPIERRRLAAFGAAGGTMLVIIPLAYTGWPWTAANWFQSATALRQYFLLILALGTSIAWWEILVGRPAGISDGLKRAHGTMLCVWLWLVAGASTTGAGGLARYLGNWRKHEYWRFSNDAILAAQIVLVICWCWRLQSAPDARLAWSSKRLARPFSVADSSPYRSSARTSMSKIL